MTTSLLADVLAIVVALTGPEPVLRQVPVPFSVGERLEYDVKFGVLKVGSGRMEVLGVETVRGREAWHTSFTVRGGTFFYKVNDKLESWIDTETFASLRHLQDLQEGKRDRERRYEIYPDRLVYTENEGEERPTPRDPLDDGSFLYFIRTMPLSVGQTYDFPRYFKPDRNPVRVRVLRKESVKVPAGRFDAIVLQPIIKSKGIFSENGRAEIWLSDDDRRIMLQLKSSLSFGTLNLYLKSYTAGTATATQ
jgi:Protein of unknown function (DUF3108)